MQSNAKSRSWRWIVWLVLPLALLLAGVDSLGAQKAAGDLMIHADEARLALNRLRSALVDIEAGDRGYLVTDDQRFLEPQQIGMRQWSVELERLRELTRDDPAQRERVAELEVLIERRLGLERIMRAAYVDGVDGKTLTFHMLREKEAMDELRLALSRIENAEAERATDRQQQRAARFGRTLALLSGSAATFILLATAARWQRGDSVSRRKHLEERLDLLRQIENERLKVHSLVMQTPAPIAVFQGPDLRLALWNRAFAQLIPDDRIARRPLAEVCPDLRRSGELDALLDSYRSGEPHTLVDHEACVLDGEGGHEKRFFTTSFHPTRDPSGNVTGVMSIGIDVTDQVRARKMLEASLRFYEHFIGILGHDLRNPLNAIVMSTTLLSVKSEAQSDPRTISRIFRSCERIARMIDQILDLARSRLAGGIPLEREPTELSSVVTAAVEELRAAHANRTIDWTPTPVSEAHWDRRRLAQVVTKLVGNALEHSDVEHPVQVRLKADADSVELSVHSFGPPIDPDVLAVIFDPYRRGARTQKSQGLGVGLFICQQVAIAHGGTLTATSSEDAGTRFVLCLPLTRRAIRRGEQCRRERTVA